jgi:hypothetical protein
VVGRSLKRVRVKTVHFVYAVESIIGTKWDQGRSINHCSENQTCMRILSSTAVTDLENGLILS